MSFDGSGGGGDGTHPKDDLVAFGYSCKIFEDDEKALFIDRGKHLIPCTADDAEFIDRYDCRGMLNELRPYEPTGASHDIFKGLNAEERQIEELCEEERYRSMDSDEDEEQEEELKRLQIALSEDKPYAEVSYNYDEDANGKEGDGEEEKPSEEVEVDEEPFTPPACLKFPTSMIFPLTKKHNEIIEKTASFISQQGPQMEIILKMKQSNNPHFNFLSFVDELYPYYRYILNAIKANTYRPKSEEEKPSFKEDESNPQALNSQLLPPPVPAPKIPLLNYKTSSDCSYSALVTKIKEKIHKENMRTNPPKLECRKLSPAEEQALNSLQSGELRPPAEKFYQMTKSARRRLIKKEKSKIAAATYKIYYAEDGGADEKVAKKSKSPPTEVGEKSPEKEKGKPAAAAAIQVKIPPHETQLMIDKVAAYVAKNGDNFESIIKQKEDERFAFLSQDHEYNEYYNKKLQLYKMMEKAGNVVPTAVAPICFSIKTKEQEAEVTTTSTLSLEPNEENVDVDEQSGHETETVPEKEETDDRKNLPDKWVSFLAEERAKAKLLAAAKEKLAVKERLAAKQRELDLKAERKRRAAEFLNSIKPVVVGCPSLAEVQQTKKNSEAKPSIDSDVITVNSSSSSDGNEKHRHKRDEKDKKRHKRKKKNKKRRYSDSDSDEERRSKRKKVKKHKSKDSRDKRR